MKPGPRPLLELPSHPPQHRKDRWDEPGPPAGAPGPGPEADFREGKGHEYRSQAAEARPRERFDAGPKEKPEEPEAQPEGRQGRAFDERRREREHGKPWERERGRTWGREREWDRGREWDRHREKDSCREWDKSKERSANRDRERERSRNRDRDRRRDRERSRSRDRDREKARERERGRDRKDRSKSKESTRDPKAEAPRAAEPAAQT